MFNMPDDRNPSATTTDPSRALWSPTTERGLLGAGEVVTAPRFAQRPLDITTSRHELIDEGATTRPQDTRQGRLGRLVAHLGRPPRVRHLTQHRAGACSTAPSVPFRRTAAPARMATALPLNAAPNPGYLLFSKFTQMPCFIVVVEHLREVGSGGRIPEYPQEEGAP